MQNPIRKLYLVAGIGTVLVFLLTGQYMLRVFPDKEALDLSFRIMQRSRHIFILLSGLGLSAFGMYFQPATARWKYSLQIIATVVLFISNTLFIYSFFYEVDPSFVPETPMMHYAAYLALAGVVLHLPAMGK